MQFLLLVGQGLCTIHLTSYTSCIACIFPFRCKDVSKGKSSQNFFQPPQILASELTSTTLPRHIICISQVAELTDTFQGYFSVICFIHRFWNHWVTFIYSTPKVNYILQSSADTAAFLVHSHTHSTF